VAIQSDGKIVVGAMVSNTIDAGDFVIYRFNPNGSLDGAFGNHGKRRVNFGPGSVDGVGWARNLVIQRDGKIVMCGGVGPGGDFGLVRLKKNGDLDKSFNGTGMQTTDFGAAETCWSIALQSDGKIVAVGHTDNNAAITFAAARYNTDGSLDTTFNGTGKQTIDFPGNNDELAYGVIVQGDGKIVLAGLAAELNNGDFALARLNSNGSLDTSFSGDGMTTFDFASGEDGARAVVKDSSGRYVLAGRATIDGQWDFGVLRVLP
jgi:uncharacterized delta-60 repeat protein